MCVKYTEANRHKYYPVPPKLPHPNTLKTPDDYPEEKKRLAILAEKKRIKDEKKKAKALAAEGIEGEQGTSKPKKRKLRRNLASPPPAHTDEERAHIVAV